MSTRDSDHGLLSNAPRQRHIEWGTLVAVSCSCVGGLMFGYDSAVVSGLLVMLKDDLGHNLSAMEKEVVTSVTSVGALVGSLIAGFSADKFGRKRMISVACIAFILSSIIMASAHNIDTLVLGRFVVGLAVGTASTCVPVYIAEIAPAEHRGKLVALNSVSTTGGQVVALFSALILQNFDMGWRIMLGIGAIPPALFLFASKGVPESPRYLIKRGYLERAEAALHTLNPHASYRDIQSMINSQSEFGKTENFNFKLLFTKRSNRNALIVACALMAAQQLCGFNAFMYYSSTIFEAAHFTNPIAMSMVFVSGTNFIFTWVAVLLIDRVGRRRMLLWTMWIMVLALFSTAWFFEEEDGVILVISTIVYVASYAAGLGNVPWQAIELMPLTVRALGAMLVSATNWICNSFVSLTFLSAMELVTPGGVFSFYAILTTLAYFGVYMCYPEVSGMNLEDIAGLFDRSLFRLGDINSFEP